MSDVLTELGTKGTELLLKLAAESLEKEITKKGRDAKIAFPETNYYLPLVNALLAIEVKDLDGCSLALKQAEGLANNNPTAGGLFIDSLGGILNKGVATVICEEILAALRVLNNEHPQEGCAGFLSDKLLRSLGIQLVDGRISGIAVILGLAKDAD